MNRPIRLQEQQRLEVQPRQRRVAGLDRERCREFAKRRVVGIDPNGLAGRGESTIGPAGLPLEAGKLGRVGVVVPLSEGSKRPSPSSWLGWLHSCLNRIR